jgi:hypothetical protein
MSDRARMDWVNLTERFGKLGPGQKLTALAKLAHELTILARDTYEPGALGLSDPVRLRGINEVMHRITSRLVNLSHGRPDDWNEPDFWGALAELSQATGAFGDLTTAASIAVGEGQP